MSDNEFNTHLLNVPKGMRHRAGLQYSIKLPECMGRDVWLSIRRDRLIAASSQSNVVVLLTTPAEMPADCG